MSQSEHADAGPSFHIAFCVDNNYFRAMGATIASIIANNPQRRFTFHVLTFAASEQHRQRLQELEQNPLVQTRLHLLETSDFAQFEHFLKSSYYSLSIFTRLVIPTVLQDVTDRVLYLDADMLCVGSLDGLAQLDMQDDIVAVAPDHPATTEKRCAALQLADPRYFNSGMLYINIPRWQEAKITEQVMQVLLDNTQTLRFIDQDVLNIVLNGRARYISRNYNYLYDMVHDLKSNETRMRPVGKAVIIHFAGPIKPWSAWTGHEATRLFAQYHQLSPWRQMPADEAPTNSTERRMHSRFLYRQGKYLLSLVWFVRYLRKHSRKR